MVGCWYFGLLIAHELQQFFLADTEGLHGADDVGDNFLDEFPAPNLPDDVLGSLADEVAESALGEDYFLVLHPFEGTHDGVAVYFDHACYFSYGWYALVFLVVLKKNVLSCRVASCCLFLNKVALLQFS